METQLQNRVDCSRVYVTESSFSTPTNKFDGAFANCDIAKGEMVECGLMRRLSDANNRCFDGMNNSYIFTWSDDLPNYTWAAGSGCSPFYNTAKDGSANTRMVRFFDEDRFEIFATCDISKGDELVHTYKSLKWRTAFAELNRLLEEGA